MEDKELYDLVIEEATNIKKFATKEELNNLDFNKLIYQKVDKCIYGLMTGDCQSIRANELILLCCSKVYFRYGVESIINYSKINKPYKIDECAIDGKVRRLSHYASPIEKWLFLNNDDNHKILINFLKSEIEILELN